MPSPFNSLSTRWINWILNSTSLLASQILHNFVGWSLFAFSLFPLQYAWPGDSFNLYSANSREFCVKFLDCLCYHLPSSGDNCSSLQAILYLYNGHTNYNNTCSIWIGTQSSWSFANMDIQKVVHLVWRVIETMFHKLLFVAHGQVTAAVPVKDYKAAKVIAEKTWSVDI